MHVIDPDTAAPPGPRPDTAADLGSELVRLVKLLVSMRQHIPAPQEGVDSTHYPVLFHLAQEPRRVSELAGCVHADASTVSRQVSHLVQHGLVAKVPDPEDGRAHRVSLTPAGRAAIDRITDSRGAWLSALMAEWTEAETRDFLQHVRRFTVSLEAARPRADRPDRAGRADR